ncbi:MAG TPA: restriction endonuclease subunit S [bacterium]|nr:restriction endonuclease subunit S [bacterium]
MKKTNLPFHWQIKRLGDVCKTTSGGTPSRKNNGYYNGDILWVKSGELDKGVIYDTEEKITLEAVNNSSAKVFPKGTLLIALYGATIGKMAFLGVDAATNQAICGIFENKNVVSKYLYYFLFLKKPSLIDQGIGGAQPNISQGILKNLQIPIPPLPEQEQIVAKIEELFSELDAGVANIKRAQEQLKVYRQSLLKWAFEGKLTNEDECSGWQIKKLGDVCKLNPKPSNPIDPELKIQFVPMKLVEEVVNKINLVETRKYCEVKKGSYTYFEDNDILFAKVTPCMENGKIAVAQNLKNGIGYGSSEFHVIRCSKDVLNKYIFYYVVQERFRKNAAAAMTGAVGLRRVPKSFLEESQIPIPPLPEQLKIVEELESRLTVCDKLEEDIKFSLARAESLRQSILKQAFEGKLLNFKGETDK